MLFFFLKIRFSGIEKSSDKEKFPVDRRKIVCKKLI